MHPPPQIPISTTRSVLTEIKHARVQNSALLLLAKLQDTEFEIMELISLMTLMRVRQNARPPVSSFVTELQQASYYNYTEKCNVIHGRIIQKFSFIAKLLEESQDALAHFKGMVRDLIRSGEFGTDYYGGELFALRHINRRNFAEFHKCESVYGLTV